MARLSWLLLVFLCLAAATVRGDEEIPSDAQMKDPWFPWWGESPPPAAGAPPPLYPSPNTPSPYYDAPPYMDTPPSEPPPESYPPTDGPGPSPWLSCGLWAMRTESWPAEYQADTPVGDVLGSDAASVYGQMSMLDGLTAKGDDGYTDLLKQGITALLNAVDAHFRYTEDEIKKCFSFKAALSSEKAASDQASDFEAANNAYSETP
jgi:hypothetical protein